MCTRGRAALLGVALAALLLTLVGCGGSAVSSHGRVTVTGDVSLILAKVPGVSPDDYRWKDIAWNVYSPAFQSAFDYANGASANVSFADASDTLRGALNATGLKPNFAYQMKLEGKPTKLWGTEGDNWSNEQVGYLGRWWCATCNKNVDDAHYQTFKNRHTIIGYLLFGFFLTDKAGGANAVPAVVDSSYHVLWNTTQRAPGVNDRPSQTCDLTFTSYGYAESFPSLSTQTIYPEWEPGRPTPGNARLPAGNYNLTFIITEESFHDSADGAGPGGNWAMAMRNTDLRFCVAAPVVHDVAISTITPAATVRKGKACTVTVAVANQGTVAESTTVSLSATSGTVTPASSPVSIPAGGTATVTFTWTPAASGTQTLTADVVAVPGETDVADNASSVSVKVK
jgi:hypothetical protein